MSMSLIEYFWDEANSNGNITWVMMKTALSSLLSTKKYDYAFNIHYNDLGFYKAILGFKDGLIEMSYYKDGLWHSELVCGSDDFSFLKPLLDDKIIK